MLGLAGCKTGRSWREGQFLRNPSSPSTCHPSTFRWSKPKVSQSQGSCELSPGTRKTSPLLRQKRGSTSQPLDLVTLQACRYDGRGGGRASACHSFTLRFWDQRFPAPCARSAYFKLGWRGGQFHNCIGHDDQTRRPFQPKCLGNYLGPSTKIEVQAANMDVDAITRFGEPDHINFVCGFSHVGSQSLGARRSTFRRPWPPCPRSWCQKRWLGLAVRTTQQSASSSTQRRMCQKLLL